MAFQPGGQPYMNSSMNAPQQGFNSQWNQAEPQRFNSAHQGHYDNQHFGGQDAPPPLPPSAEFGHNILNTMAMMAGNPNSNNPPPSQPGSLETSIVTQHLHGNQSLSPNQMQFQGGFPQQSPNSQYQPQPQSGPTGSMLLGMMHAHMTSQNMFPPQNMPPPVNTLSNQFQSGFSQPLPLMTTTEVHYGSRNLNQIAEEIRQSQIRSSRMQGSAFINPLPIRQSNVVMIPSTGIVAPLPVDDIERQRRSRVCGCPCWFCTLFILLLVALLVALFFLLFRFNGWGIGLWKSFEACPSGSHPFGSKCLVCPKDTKWNGNECLPPGSTGELNEFSLVGVDAPIVEQSNSDGECKQGFNKHLGRCLKCPATSTWNGTECAINMNFPENVVEQPKPEVIAKPIEPPKPTNASEKSTVVEPLRKEPAKKKLPAPQLTKTGHCDPGYIYYRTGCVPLIAHHHAERHIHLRSSL